MNIVVTIPKKMLPQIEREEKLVRKLERHGTPCTFFWKIGRKPKKLIPGDRCYFVWDGAVRAWHTVIGFAKDVKCDMTGILHSGICVVLGSKINEIEPVPMKGFRGFRYYGKSDS